MHILQYIAVKAVDEHDAIQNVRMDLEDCIERGDNWFDWFDEDGGRWASSDKPISFAADPQKFVEKFAWLMNHRSAVLLMLLVTLMWSSAGVVTRHLDAARGFEITFWRSAFNALALVVILGFLRGQALLSAMRGGVVWASGVCWAVMFT